MKNKDKLLDYCKILLQLEVQTKIKPEKFPTKEEGLDEDTFKDHLNSVLRRKIEHWPLP